MYQGDVKVGLVNQIINLLSWARTYVLSHSLLRRAKSNRCNQYMLSTTTKEDILKVVNCSKAKPLTPIICSSSKEFEVHLIDITSKQHKSRVFYANQSLTIFFSNLIEQLSIRRVKND